jgi:two-component system phosphate regulon sensor histidine kinase PhoR
MYKWLVILSVIIISALCGLTLLGYHSVRLWAKGAQGARLGEFAAVAEQVREDVKRKLETFIEKEQQRPYTDYLYYYALDNVANAQDVNEQQMMLLRSPIGTRLAYGNFQIEPDWQINTHYYRGEQPAQSEELSNYLKNVRSNVLPALKGQKEFLQRANEPITTLKEKEGQVQTTGAVVSSKSLPAAVDNLRVQTYPIEALQKAPQQTQVVQQQKEVAYYNVAQNTQTRNYGLQKEQADLVTPQPPLQPSSAMGITGGIKKLEEARQRSVQTLADESKDKAGYQQMLQEVAVREIKAEENTKLDTDKVQVRIEPFVPIVVAGGDLKDSLFGGQVFLLRHVQIENRHFIQGFKLNEKQLLDDVNDSAGRFMRRGMTYELAKVQNPAAAYSAILDFGFGSFILNIMETDPAWIGRQIAQIRMWYFSIVAVVSVAAAGGLASLWRNVREQVKLAQKKDDFISAVSHELRTPLTSIRMYSEMLDRDWVKSPEKQKQYYTSLRQESERLSRLIENVLDFSRIQKGRKTYNFRVGQIDKCVESVVEMMRPYASQNGFKIVLECNANTETSFDSDTVTQIVVNLIDNAVKYARDAEDKTIYVRTQNRDGFILIEVEDRGPGIPHHQQKKVFEEFYRVEAENTRQTQGMGLGLALVRRFAEAHNGFVEILSAKPTGSLFRVALAAQS